MLTVVETQIFRSYAAGIWHDAEREAFIDWISTHYDQGDVIQHTGGLRKVRWTRPGMGKRGGARVIYYTRLAHGQVVLIVVYTKTKFDAMPTVILKKWKEATDETFDH